jgi:hypothetical protein
VDGFLSPARLTGGDCLAILDRAVEKLGAIETGRLEDHPAIFREDTMSQVCARRGIMAESQP